MSNQSKDKRIHMSAKGLVSIHERLNTSYRDYQETLGNHELRISILWLLRCNIRASRFGRKIGVI